MELDRVVYVPSFDKDFGWALTQARMGARLSRGHWNGRYIVLQKGYPDGIPINANTAEATGIEKGTVCKFAPYFMMRSLHGSFAPWSASNDDLLATNWDYAQGYVKGETP